MGQKVLLRHVSSYRYDRSIRLGHQTIRLRPAPHSRTEIASYSLNIDPDGHFFSWLQDPYGNFLGRVVFPERVDHFTATVELVANLEVYNPFDFFIDPSAATIPFDFEDGLKRDLAPYLERGAGGKRFSAYMRDIGSPKGDSISVLVDINRRVYQDISYNIRMEQNIQQSEQTLALGSGSCRDSALLLVEILRELGIASRFVSGYLIQLVPDLPPRSGSPGPSADFTDLHAWAEAYVPGAGWVGLDPTSGLLAGEGHIPLAAAPRPGSAAPIEGSLEACRAEFSHHMEVQRIDQQPRSSRPIALELEQPLAQRLDRVGEAVELRLQTLGYRLSSGGEPTFVAEDDRNAKEWGTDAMGPTKKPLAMKLMRSLMKTWAPGGLIHIGQGKWYPGESLPRWALSCYWRADGKALWNRPDLLCDPDDNPGYGIEHARTFMDALVERLGVDPQFMHPAYEDPMHFMLAERNLPPNVSLDDSKLDNPEDRARLERVLSRGLEEPIGYVLPIQRGSWKSGPWPTRAGRLLLIPGDSPMGLRLPLPSIPWADGPDRFRPAQDPSSFPPSLAQNSPGSSLGGGSTFSPELENSRSVALPPRINSGTGAPGSNIDTENETQHHTRPLDISPLQLRVSRSDAADHTGSRQSIHEQQAPQGQPQALPGESAAWIVRTALTVQPRDGKLYVFMPPVRAAADWFALIDEIHASCEKTGIRIILEGYLPPSSPDYLNFQITPDPGVIEVNLPPALRWDRWSREIRELYHAARECGLSAEKYLMDGRVVGSGGGCHWVFGGPTTRESPFLLRPDLLASWIRYCNNHPSLSYAFTGLFIGASSQAPRPDEVSLEAIPNLELAFASLENHRDPMPLWMPDRLFRNFLTDGAGNTHRSEICIDKLYSPDHVEGRRGLVEFRSFEMASQADIALSQNLLLRALCAAFLEHPYRQPMKHWGNKLRDKWMLPHFLWQDISSVLDDLSARGFDIPREYFRAFWEIRFPHIGSLDWTDSEGTLSIGLRHALEPWPVTGEEPGGGGTVRYVDSSVERIQILAENFDPNRYAILCRGRTLPLHQVAPGRFVCGIRYKAWKFYAGLHPAIDENPELVIDVYDRREARIVAGCTYSCAHPGGRSYDSEPVNAFEAEARRAARFTTMGHSPSTPFSAPVPAPPSEYPLTLDLRYPL